MKIIFYIILVVLVFLAVSSGLAKILLVPRDVEFFGQYGFSEPILVAYGLLQVAGAALLAIPNTRIIGAILVALTFLLSAIVLFVSGNIPVALVTLVFTALLGFIMKFSGRIRQA